ncbi:MAG: AraC family transcriptional regulator [Massiliimalia sp.]
MHYLDYNEKQQHGTSQFPLGFYRVDENHPRYHMPFHWHKEWEILRVVQGNILLYLEDETILAQTGDIIFILDGEIHGGSPQNCVYECIVFDPQPLFNYSEMCKQCLRPILNRQVTVQTHFTKKDSALSQITRQLFYSVHKKETGSQLVTLGCLYQFLGTILQKKYYREQPSLPRQSGEKMMALKPVFEWIEEHFSSHITLEDLSKTAGMSPKYFCRYFRAVTHRTPMDYLNFCRIEHGAYLLSSTELTVSETAYRCGFPDTSYFIRIFKKYKGITPKQYAQRYPAYSQPDNVR